MNELPLSKFAPFSKDESLYQHEVSNKLKEINVKCSNCIYLGEKLPSSFLGEEEFIEDHIKDLVLYKCNIFQEGDNTVNSEGLCRFFTNKEEVEAPEENEKSKDVVENNQEMSLDLQKLDFTSSNIIETINELRNKLINENK